MSVNYTDETTKKEDFWQFRPLTASGQDFNQYCVATSDQIEMKGGVLRADRLPGNDLHYLLNGKAKEIAKVLTRYPMFSELHIME
ncbi:MAG: hypothetical protein F6K24_00775 [Okeania sp. SIO2D1]|nr:hypothetical protein [Okeania sp. SIO2D1]